MSFSEEKAEEIDQLKNDIKEAFKDLDLPESINIALHECDECAAVRRAFANLGWQEVNEDLLNENYDVIPLFSPEAFRYYLPAYLLYTLEHFDDEFSEVCEFTLYALTPGDVWKDQNGDVSSYWIDKLRLFSEEQMDVIYRFLELAKSNPIYQDQTTAIERAPLRLQKIHSLGRD